MAYRRGLALLGLVLLPVGCIVATDTADPTGENESPQTAAGAQWVTSGLFEQVYEAGPDRYINDHTFVRGPDGTWHMFGITGKKTPPNAFVETVFAHATAPSLQGPWTTVAPALTVDPRYGEEHLWAPHIIKSGSLYWMFYNGGGGPDAPMNLATSSDLMTWQRHPGGTLFRDGITGRDPMVVRIGDRWVMYYCANATKHGGAHVVAYRTSTDLIHWSARNIAFTDPANSSNAASNTESPFVIQHDGWWYLFIGPRGGYVGTDVYRSRDPFKFDLSNYAGHIHSHAAEVIDDDGKLWVSACGIQQHGVYLAELKFQSRPRVWQSVANPAIARNRDGRLEAFAITPDSRAILHRAQKAPDGAFGEWEVFGDAAAAVPTVGENEDGRLSVFAIGPDGDYLAHRKQTVPGGPYGEWERFGGPAGAAPIVGRNADGRLEVFAIGTAGGWLSRRVQTAPNGDWGEWERFGGPAAGPPVVAQNADGRLEVFALGPHGAYVSHRWQNQPNGDWHDWEPFGGPAAIAPTVARNADGRLEVYALNPVGTGIGQRVQAAPNGDWHAWQPMGGWTGATPTVASNADGRLEAFTIDIGNNQIVHNWQQQPNGRWAGWQNFGGPAQCAPTVVRRADGRLAVFALGINGSSIAQRVQAVPSGEWSEWTAFGGAVGGIPCGAP